MDEETILDRIQARLNDLGWNKSYASIKCGLDRSYLSTAFSRRTYPRRKSLKKLAAGLKTTEQWLAFGDEGLKAIPPIQIESPKIASYTETSDIGILSVKLTTGGLREDGRFRILDLASETVFLPRSLKGQGIYSFRLPTGTMRPQFKPGDLIIVDPRRPPRRDDAVLIYFRKDHREGREAIVGILTGDLSSEFTIETHHPFKRHPFRISEVEDVHLILSINEIFGL